MAKRITTLADLTQDPENANKGTERGAAVIKESLATLGAGRSVLADVNGTLIAGNKTTKTALALGMRAKVVDIEPDEILVARRPDLDLTSADDDRARKLAYMDNLAGFLDLAWDQDRMFADAGRLDLTSVGFSAKDLEAHFRHMTPAVNFQDDAPASTPATDNVAPAQTDAPVLAADPEHDTEPAGSEYVRMVQLFLTSAQFDRFHDITDRIKAATGAANHTDAAMLALEHWMSGLEQGNV